ncbi:hypothetical protein OF83DRAFT_557407 [Amylostereum chailletii]|nr:hypothetical protein OF83DRAFT_557407 [Amylostereum chailletii]
MSATSETSLDSSLQFWRSIFEKRCQASSGLSSSTDQTVFEWFDLEIDALAELTRLAKARRNNSTLISRLPPEILSKIFLFLRDVSQPQAIKPARTSNLGWIGVSHVCQTWRRLAIEYSNLWNNLDCRSISEAWRSAFLSRSGQAPLKVTLPYLSTSFTHDQSARSLKYLEYLVQSHSQRLQDLALLGADAEFLQHLYHPLPAISCLAIEGYRTLALLDFNKLATNAPHLTWLGLGNISHVNPATQPFTQLTECTIYYDTGSTRPSFPLWEGLLSCFPNLQVLRLTDAFPSEFAEESDTDVLPAIQLPASLTQLALTICAPSCVSPMLTFLRHLVAPSACVNMQFRAPLSADTFSDALASRDAAAPSAVSLDFHGSGVSIGLYRDPWPPSNGDAAVHVPDLHIGAKEMSSYQPIESVCGKIEWDKVATLTYTDDRTNGSQSGYQHLSRWSAVASLATEVRHLRVTGDAALGFLHLLTDHATNPETTASSFLRPSRLFNAKLFPRLELLSFGDASETSDRRLGPLLLRDEDRLLVALALRRLHKIPLRELRLPRDVLQSETVQRLRAMVPNIGASEHGKY